MWDSRVLPKLDEGIGVFYAFCVFKNTNDDFQWLLTGVYGPNANNLRASYWQEL